MIRNHAASLSLAQNVTRRRFAFLSLALAALAAALAGLAYFLLERRNMPAAPAPAAYSAEDRREGVHCLGPDETHEEVVRRVTAELPNPETFEHKGTVIFPMRYGQHFLVMRYRSLAPNGRRMDAAVAVTRVDHEHCRAGEITRLD